LTKVPTKVTKKPKKRERPSTKKARLTFKEGTHEIENNLDGPASMLRYREKIQQNATKVTSEEKRPAKRENELLIGKKRIIPKKAGRSIAKKRSIPIPLALFHILNN
jgi:hypothetical protein